MYERKTAQNKASVIRRLVNLKYRDGRSVTKHLSDFQGLINLLTNMKMVLDDELQALVLLSSLPDSWDTLVVSLSNSAPQGVLTLDIVKDSMFNEEARRKEQGVIAESEALVSEYRGRTNNRKFHRRDKSKGRSRDGSRGRSKIRKDLECYHCGGIGHMKRECRLFKREQDRGNEKSDARHTTATTSDGNEAGRSQILGVPYLFIGSLIFTIFPNMSAIVPDLGIVWATRVASRRNIPVASLWPMSASVISEREDDEVLADLDFPTELNGDGLKMLKIKLEIVRSICKAQYLVSSSVYELEPEVFDNQKAKFDLPIYPFGPSIPYFELSKSPPTNHNYLYNWLDSQPRHSVLYISLGSFLSVSKAQMDEIVAGVQNSDARFLWVARGDASKLKDGDKGLVVSWCDQLWVLCHDSIGDQIPNAKKIVEDWKIGYRVLKKKVGATEHEHLVTREEIAEFVQRIMDL
ncbi:hypothetical protein L3X38_030697 [Prunus dulcis]|uniref:CCHC-type domain-containing protein n=1 Tax=Prunus dulcis TaxID=3755 RepID=A0AAD4VBY7_PRUDU|nr:hypothetical protein L3X38_030697 [Prunus dulcis]